MQDKLLDMLMQKDEITWKTIIYDLVKTEQMNPWDIDISLLVAKYLEIVKRLQETNFFISGKVLLAAAILLKMKSIKLVDEDIAEFDSMIFPQEDLGELEDYMESAQPQYEIPKLAMKTPQARKRRVTVQDLVHALEKALDVDKKRMLRKMATERFLAPTIPEKKIDISELIKRVFEKVRNFFTKEKVVTFAMVVGESGKEEKIQTFIPLLHLANQEKIDLDQKEHLGEIYITLKSA